MTVRHIFIPTDGSEDAMRALERAVEFAAQLQAKVTFFVATDPFFVLSAEAEQLEHSRRDFLRYEHERAAGILEQAMDVAQRYAVAGASLQRESARPHEAIIDEALRCGADIIAMGSHGRGGLGSVVLGSVTQKVLAHCTIPVLVYRRAAT